MKRNFHDVYLNGDYHEKNLPVMLICNHLSWWDGFWAMYLNIKLLHRKFHFMMLEEQLKKYMFFNKSGGYSVKKGSRSIIETLDYTAQLLTDKKNMVLLFPQGEIQSLYTRTIHFEKGIGHILKKVKNEVQIIFLVNLIDYFSRSKPGLYMYFNEFAGNDVTAENLQKEYNHFYEFCIAQNLSIRE
jgi:1-acyl-sn-glycerol-3-phosphate acyltransferase